MTGPETIRDYMGALNASLEVGLRSRRSILRELYDHLCQAAYEELHRGETEQEAQRRAIAAFGSPQEVAAGFESGLAGQIDKRLAIVARRVDVWMAQHPWSGAALRIGFFLPAAAAIAAVGAAFGAVEPGLQVAAALLQAVSWWSLYLGFKAWRLRRRPEPGLRERMWAEDPRLLGVEEDAPLGGGGMAGCLRGGLGGYAASVGASWVLFVASTGVAAAVLVLLRWFVHRIYPQDNTCEDSRCEDGSLRAFRLDHPWWGALLHASYVPLSVLAVVLLISPGPLGFRIALGPLIVVITATVAVFRCLSWDRDERVAIQRATSEST